MSLCHSDHFSLFKVQRHLPASLFDAFLGDGEILGVFLDAYILPLLDHSSHAGSAAPHRIVKNYPPPNWYKS